MSTPCDVSFSYELKTDWTQEIIVWRGVLSLERARGGASSRHGGWEGRERRGPGTQENKATMSATLHIQELFVLRCYLMGR